MDKKKWKGIPFWLGLGAVFFCGVSFLFSVKTGNGELRRELARLEALKTTHERETRKFHQSQNLWTSLPTDSKKEREEESAKVLKQLEASRKAIGVEIGHIESLPDELLPKIRRIRVRVETEDTLLQTARLVLDLNRSLEKLQMTEARLIPNEEKKGTVKGILVFEKWLRIL